MAITPPGATLGQKVHAETTLRYVLVWVALLCLTALTFALSYVEMGAASVAVALVIAIGKSTLVVLFFMHLLHEVGAPRLTLVVSTLLVLLLGAFAIIDEKTRFPPSTVG